MHWIKKDLEVFGIGIGIQRPCKYWDWDWDWERGNLCNIFGIGLGIGILNAYNSKIGIEPFKVNRSNKFLYTKNRQTTSFILIACSHLQVKTRVKIILFVFKPLKKLYVIVFDVPYNVF